MGYMDVVKSISGLTHYYPLNKEYQARDAVGSLNGTNHGATFADNGATFDGRSYIELPDHADFSAVTKGGLSIVVSQVINNWKGAGASEYVHWAGKGVAGQHEWTFRHYVLGGTGEAATRQYRTSFYAYNLSGGLGAGSYFQDPDPVGYERFIVGQYDASSTEMWKNAAKRDSDALSGYNIKLAQGSAPVRLGTRDMSTGYLVGRLRRVAFYNRKLTATEIKKLYDARTLPEVDASTPTPTPTPVDNTTPSATGSATSTTLPAGLADGAAAQAVVDAVNGIINYLKARGI